MRELECELAFLNKCDGSAAFQHGWFFNPCINTNSFSSSFTNSFISSFAGTTRTLCAVYGPAEVKLNQEKVDRSTLDCIIKPKIGLAGIYIIKTKHFNFFYYTF